MQQQNKVTIEEMNAHEILKKHMRISYLKEFPQNDESDFEENYKDARYADDTKEAYDAFIDAMKEYGASYQLQNSVSKEYYDELVEENKRLNERERELKKILTAFIEWDRENQCEYNWNYDAIIDRAKAAISNHKK